MHWIVGTGAGSKGIFKPGTAGFATEFVHLADEGHTLVEARRFFEQQGKKNLKTRLWNKQLNFKTT